MKTSFATHSGPLSRAAFTLVETVLAIGMVSTVLIALLGLLPTGMDIMGEAGQRTVGARVAQQLMSEMQASPFVDLESFDGETRYFDDQGTEVSTQSLAVYTALIEVDGEPQDLPGGGSYTSDFLKGVVVKVALSLREPNFADNAAGESYLRYATTVVDMSRQEF